MEMQSFHNYKLGQNSNIFVMKYNNLLSAVEWVSIACFSLQNIFVTHHRFDIISKRYLNSSRVNEGTHLKQKQK